MSYSRGSVWGKWDLHIHSPASFNWNGGKRIHQQTDAERIVTLQNMVQAINDADIEVFAVMDYWTFEGYIALRKYASENPSSLVKTVLPGIELRIQSPTTERLDIHAILSDQLHDQDLTDFLSKLEVQIIGGQKKPLSRQCLILYARSLRDDQLAKHSMTREQLVDDEMAWQLGSQTCEVTFDSFREAMESLPANSAVVFQPWDTYHGLKDLKWQNHYTSAYNLFKQPDIFECKDQACRAAFVGHKNQQNETFFDGFWSALEGRPRLAVRGSDAHKFSDYGKFQSGLTTWIKATPTFRGLLQAIKEPADRSFLDIEPPKLVKRREKPTVFIDRLLINKTAESTLNTEDWFDATALDFNPDLVAVIGSKGSGKSALADILALLGDTSNTKSFSFLRPDRFRERRNDRSRHFEGHLLWASKEPSNRRLSENPPDSAVERVRYIPQSYFEQVCSGQSEEDVAEFTAQIERVIYSYIPHGMRGDSTDLSSLLIAHEQESSRRMEQLRMRIREINKAIVDIRSRSTKDVRAQFEAELVLRKRQLADLLAAKPIQPPADLVTPIQDPAASKLAELTNLRSVQTQGIELGEKQITALQEKESTATKVLASLKGLRATVQTEIERLRPDIEEIGLDATDLVQMKVDTDVVVSVLAAVKDDLAAKIRAVRGSDIDSLIAQRSVLEQQIQAVRSSLSAKELELQAERERFAKWESDVSVLQGAKDSEKSVAWVEAQILWVNEAPALLRRNEATRAEICADVAQELIGVTEARSQLVDQARDAIGAAFSDTDDFHLSFQNQLIIENLEERFFEFIKQISGTFKGEEEGRRAFKELVASQPLTTAVDIIQLAQQIEHALMNEDRDGSTITHDLNNLLRKGKTSEDLLNMLYGLDYIRPRFSLALNDQPLGQLSPGQRGALLLVFYLLVEGSDIPIILDQPEENLDNETVYSLLVPVIKRAKSLRQVIMVTHNANLAVCCDAEQIVHASFDKANQSKVTYRSGPIEDPEINRLVLDVLEGTQPAFNNRRTKYQSVGS